MIYFRFLLIVQTTLMFAYTFWVGSQLGWDFLSPFLREMVAFTWQGQFQLDFFLLLTLSSLWVAWRNAFSPVGLLLALLTLVGGISFLAPYLLYLTFQESSDPRCILLGRNERTSPNNFKSEAAK